MTLATTRNGGPVRRRFRKLFGLRSLWENLQAVRRGSVLIWDKALFINDILGRRFLGQWTFFLSAPDALRHVLLDNADNYTKSHLEAAVFRPVMGKGII